MCVMRILLSLRKEIPQARRHSAQFRQLFQACWVQACRDQPRGVELVNNIFRRALWLGSKVNHRTEAAVETVFATRRCLIDRHFRLRTQNPGDGQNLGFRYFLKGENVRVLTFESGEFVFSYRLVAGKKAAGQNQRMNKQNSENSASRNGTSVWRLSRLTIFLPQNTSKFVIARRAHQHGSRTGYAVNLHRILCGLPFKICG